MRLWSILLLSYLSTPWLSAQSVILEQATLGEGINDIDDANLELKSRFTYEIDIANLDTDPKLDLILCHFYLFNPPLSEGPVLGQYHPVRGTGGLSLYFNVSDDDLASPTPHNGGPAYKKIKGQFEDLSTQKIKLWLGDHAPSVRDAEIADLDGDGDMDIVLSCGVGVDPNNVSLPNLALNRILIQRADGCFYDETRSGGDGINRFDSQIANTNTCGVCVADVDQDEDLDIVFGEYGNDFAGAQNKLLLNNGNGYFTTQLNPFIAGGGEGSPVKGATADVEFAYLDDDAYPDLVVANANPKRASVFTTGWVFDPVAAAPRENEVWINDGQGGFSRLTTPQPDHTHLGQNQSSPYNDPGFWNDTRSVAILDLDGDNKKTDILFANNGWEGDDPAGRTHTFRGEVPGQQPQLLLNTSSGSTVTFEDVTETALPFGKDQPGTSLVPKNQWRAFKDFEPVDLGSPSDLVLEGQTFPTQNESEWPKGPIDSCDDLLVAIGPMGENDVWINSGDWTYDSTNNEYRGRFFRGNMGLQSDWANNIAGKTWAGIQIPADGVGFGFGNPDRFYSHDIDGADFDGDGWPDIVVADGDPIRGEGIGLYFYRGVNKGFRWQGPSDEGHYLPRFNSLFSYDCVTRDIEGDGDMDIIVAGTPTLLVWINQGGAQQGREGEFKERTFDGEGGLLPLTHESPVYAPVLTEAVEAADFTGDGRADIVISGYALSDQNGNVIDKPNNEGHEWHMKDDEYKHPYDVKPFDREEIYTTFYFAQQPSGSFTDQSRPPMSGAKWFDRASRYDLIGESARAADLDGDGDEDLVIGRRSSNQGGGRQTSPGNMPAHDPSVYSTVLSLFMNHEDSLGQKGYLVDETLVRLPLYSTDPDNFWNQAGDGIWESICPADIDSDGDLDLLISNRGKAGSPNFNMLLVNMGGDQKSLVPKSHQNWVGSRWRTGEFRALPFNNRVQPEVPASPVASWSTPHSPTNIPASPVLEMCDINGDDQIDFLMRGNLAVTGGLNLTTFLLINTQGAPTTSGFGNFSITRYPGAEGALKLDAGLNGSVVSETHPAAVPGDFDHDGDMDIILLGENSNVSRYLENKMSDANNDGFVDPSDGSLEFEDRTSKTSLGNLVEDAMEWANEWAWGSTSVVADFNGDGIHDLYIANQSRNAQDELFLAVPPSGWGGAPSITAVVPPTGAVASGETLRLLGTDLDQVTELIFRKFNGSTITISSSEFTKHDPRIIDVPMPSDADFGPQKVIAVKAPNIRSNQFLVTHLNRSPLVGEVQSAPYPVFLVEDIDGSPDWNTFTVSVDLGPAQTVGPQSGTDPWFWTNVGGNQFHVQPRNGSSFSGSSLFLDGADNDGAASQFTIQVP